MLKTMLYDLSKSFMKTDCKTIVCHGDSEGHLRISSVTDDKQLYIYAESVNNEWSHKEFAFRDWSAVASIMSSFYDVSEPSNCTMTLDVDSENYPNVLRVKNGSMKMTHYLQNYTFICRQDDLLNSYKGKKFTLKGVDYNEIEDLNSDMMSKISKLSSLTSEKCFKVGLENNGLYFYFGDSNKTVDNAKICVCEDYQGKFVDKGLYFSVDYLAIAINSLKDQNIKIKFDGNLITVCGENEVSKKVIAVVGKKEV